MHLISIEFIKIILRYKPPVRMYNSYIPWFTDMHIPWFADVRI